MCFSWLVLCTLAPSVYLCILLELISSVSTAVHTTSHIAAGFDIEDLLDCSCIQMPSAWLDLGLYGSTVWAVNMPAVNPAADVQSPLLPTGQAMRNSCHMKWLQPWTTSRAAGAGQIQDEQSCKATEWAGQGRAGPGQRMPASLPRPDLPGAARFWHL